MKIFLYVVIGVVAMAGAIWVITAGGQAPASHPLMLLAFVALFLILPVGALWMMYVSVRYEKKPLPLVFLAFVPFTFLWYYFERVRPGKVRRKNRDFA